MVNFYQPKGRRVQEDATIHRGHHNNFRNRMYLTFKNRASYI
jgi:hypothetical protein